jgi:hypothetical protein
MRQVRYRALIALDPDAQQNVRKKKAQEYLNHTHTVMVRAHCLSRPSYTRVFPAELSWEDERPLHPGDHAEVTITMTDDEADAFFGAGQRISLWTGTDIGHGTISRRVFTEYGPC